MSSPLASNFSRSEPTPWALGLTVATVVLIFSAGVLLGIFEVIDAFDGVAAVAAVLFVAVGLGTTLWELRVKAVWRWITWGTVLGLCVGSVWAALLALTHG